jgi:hypothetical protein
VKGQTRGNEGTPTKAEDPGALKVFNLGLFIAPVDVTCGQIDRLKDRGFVKNNLWGTRSVTFKRYFALILRITVARDRPALAEKHRVSP